MEINHTYTRVVGILSNRKKLYYILSIKLFIVISKYSYNKSFVILEVFLR